jgi:hypothetical protein
MLSSSGDSMNGELLGREYFLTQEKLRPTKKRPVFAWAGGKTRSILPGFWHRQD